MKVRICSVVMVIGILAAACGGSDATATTAAVAPQASTTTTMPAADQPSPTAAETVETAPPADAEHPFDQLVYERYALMTMTLYDDTTGEWLEDLPPSAAVTTWYCSGQADPYRSGWSWTWDGDPPELIDDYQAWNDEFWGLAEESLCPELAASSTQTAVSAVPADLVPFFYPGYELEQSMALDEGDGSAFRIVAMSTSTPGFRIVFDAAIESDTASGCDFVDAATGQVWCHSTAPGGLEAFAGRNAMLPASYRPSIETDIAPDHVLVTYFGLVSNVEIVLRAINPNSVETWDASSYDREIRYKLDLAGGVWQRQ